jgi:transposase
MPSAVKLRTDFSAAELRRLAKHSKDNNTESPIVLAGGGAGRHEPDRRRADRQTLRDWVHWFNEAGPDRLRDHWAGGPDPRLSAEHKAELAAIVEAGPNREVDGVVRWRRVDLRRVIKNRFGVDYCERYVGTLLKKLGFVHISARPRHPGQDAEIGARPWAHVGRSQ